MNFELNLIFLIKRIFLHEQNIRDKNLKILKKKELLRWNKKRFFIISKGLLINQITQIFLEGESPTFRLKAGKLDWIEYTDRGIFTALTYPGFHAEHEVR